MKKKVLVLLNNIPLYGSERGNINVYYALKEKQIDSLFVTHSKYGYLYINPYLENLGLKHVPAPYIGKICRRESYKEYFLELKNSIIGNYRVWKIIRTYKPDFIHIPTETSFLSMFITLFLTKIPVIFRVGDSPRQNRWIFTFIWKKFIIPRVYRFVCISKFIKSKLMLLGVKENKIEVIYNSPPYRVSSLKSDSNGSIIEANTFLVTYIGQISEEKGVNILIEAAISLCNKYDNIHFYIAGDYKWQNPFAAQLIKLVNVYKLNNRIHFLGMVENVNDLLKKSQLHVCPSVWEEPLSNVTVEAKEAGIPSIIFSSGGLPELISHNIDGYICKEKTADELIKAIEYYYHQPEKLHEAGKAALESMNKLDITRKSFTEKWNKVFQN